MIGDDDDWGEGLPSHVCRCLVPLESTSILPVEPKLLKSYYRVEREEEVTKKEDEPTQEVPLNRATVSTASPIPVNWIMNARTHHGPLVVGDDSADYPTRRVDPCPGCVECIMATNRGKGLKVGEPVQVHSSYPVELLEEKSLVGIYYPSRECAVCKGPIVVSDSGEKDKEYVHIDCLSEEEQQLARSMGLTGHVMRHKKVEKGDVEEQPSAEGEEDSLSDNVGDEDNEQEE